ncbi:hypothetical protein G3M48_006204 [Beauveria asiatica]|uniref:Uncharacterized protein n=1 Tax=Beauveria asiatica TaxID=1069075 RepID=A0AAW0S510_9HYPO
MSLFTAALTISADLPVAIAWIATVNSVDFSSVIKDPKVSLYKFVHDVESADRNAAPRVEGASRYEYYVDGKWTSQRPGIDNRGVEVANSSAGGQGTYFYSPFWKK